MSTGMSGRDAAQARSMVRPWWPVALLAAGGLFLYAFRDVVAGLVHQWQTNDAFSHGYLIAPISLYIAWTRRDRLALAGIHPALVTGTLLLAAAVLALQAGRVAGVLGIQQLAMLLGVAALIVLLAGWRALRTLWFPVLYLLFMMPVWDIVTERMHASFQLLSARLGTALLRLVGVPVFLHDVFIALPNITLEVARVCSGVNYLVAILALAVPLAYLTLRSHVRKVALLVFGVLAGFLFNALRVAAIGYVSYHGLSQYTHGPWHVFQGLSAALAGYAAIFAFWGWLQRRDAGLPPRPWQPRGWGPARPDATPARLVTAGVVALALLAWGARPLALQGARAGVRELPDRLDGWVAAPAAVRVMPPRVPAPGPDGVERAYRDGAGMGRADVLVTPLGASARDDGRPDFWADNLEADAVVRGLGAGAVHWLEPRRFLAPPRYVAFWYQDGRRAMTWRHEAKLFLALRAALGQPAPVVAAIAVDTDNAEAAAAAVEAIMPAVREAIATEAAR